MNLFRSADIKKLFLIGTSIISAKSVLLLIAYFFDELTYNRFNQAYYTASLLMLFGGLGFNIAITRVSLRKVFLVAAVIVNIIIAYTLLNIFVESINTTAETLSLMIYSIFAVLGSIYVFQLLFSGSYFRFVTLTLTYSFLHLLIIPMINIYDVNLYILLPLISATWFFIGLPFYLKISKSVSASLFNFYKIGFSAFIINSSIPLALVLDKFIVNRFFDIEIANAYTFAWGLTAPLFYIGNIVEKLLYSEKKGDDYHLLKKGFFINIPLVVLYSLLALSMVNLFPSLLPGSVNASQFLIIFPLMISGYTAYVIFHFPVNAYLFKVAETEKHKLVAFSFLIVTAVIFICCFVALNTIVVINFKSLLVMIWFYIFTLLIVKSYLLFKEDLGIGVQVSPVKK